MCKSTGHKDHETMELSEYKERSLTQLEDYKKYLEAYAANLEKLRLSNSKHNGSERLGNEEDNSLVCLTKQSERIKEALASIEEATDPFLLDLLKSFEAITDAHDKLLNVYREDHMLPESVSHSLILRHPRVRTDCGLVTQSGDRHLFCLCKNEDVVIAGEDSLEKKWRVKRFTRLGHLVWNKYLPLAWTCISGVIEFISESKEGILFSNDDEGKIVMVSGENMIQCYEDKEKAPGTMLLSPDYRLLIFMDYENDSLIFLDTTSTPFVSIRSILIGTKFPYEMTLLPAEENYMLVVTSPWKRKIKAISVKDGKVNWTIGPIVAGQEITPHGICSSQGKGCNKSKAIDIALI